MSELISREAFKVIEGRPVTSSRIVAEYFSKRHNDVLRDVRTILEKKPELSSNFIQSEETIIVGNGATRTTPVIMMDRKGFSILAMGFTGAKALDFKCAFYDEFERMEKALHPTCPVAATLTIDAAQQLAVKKAVAKRAKNVAVHYQTLYRALYDRFQVPRYTELLRSDFDEAIRFIETCEIRPQIEAAPSIPEGAVIFTRFEAERVRGLVYGVKYLYRPELNAFLQFLQLVNSPLAPRFWELVNDLGISLLEKTLEKYGLAVTDMDCYKALTR